ncbi:hypothetical protein [Cesiribacter andamanensis]|uniref:Lipoprotein n=1 Tax=Cesiribacter andamanensis AMV16 TaxID=1279009 RepID=M7N4G9_9BACT|nr:hypothetical protein [Cesiribacter andamanensis]EMR02192.1 hypothetical protein ADICEAN_02667 [Cesiribacter andamanensis AMV16]
MKRYTPLLLLMLAAACQTTPADIAGFNAYLWKQDKAGCGRERSQMVDTLMVQRDKLLQLNENELISLLGNPDARELWERNQKFLIYLLEPNARCQAPEDAPVTAKALHIRLSAIGRANEVFIGSFKAGRDQP